MRLSAIRYRGLRSVRDEDAYYVKLIADARSFALECEPGDWFDHWHTHVDWDGLGNRSPGDRRKHLEALLVVFDRVSEQAAVLEIPYQTWVVVHEADSAQDAVYLHTANEQGGDFLHDFEGVAWGCPVPRLLAGLIDSNHVEVGHSSFEKQTQYWLRARTGENVGAGGQSSTV